MPQSASRLVASPKSRAPWVSSCSFSASGGKKAFHSLKVGTSSSRTTSSGAGRGRPHIAYRRVSVSSGRPSSSAISRNVLPVSGGWSTNISSTKANDSRPDAMAAPIASKGMPERSKAWASRTRWMSPGTKWCSPSRAGTIPRATRRRRSSGPAPLACDSSASVIAPSLMDGW